MLGLPRFCHVSSLTARPVSTAAVVVVAFDGTSMRDEEITELALAAGRGDADATAAFIRATQADVWRYVAYLVDRAGADDLTQETYLRALRGLRTFQGQTAARVWLLSIALRAVVDHFRKQGRRPQAATSLDATDGAVDRLGPAQSDAADELSLRLLIDGLDEDKRAAFVLTQVHGLSYAEAAEVCGVPIGTIRSRMARAREQLVAEIAEPAPVEERTAAPRRLRRLR
jgi:RNA polymerase sigma-70 factor (ECF subfamily)